MPGLVIARWLRLAAPFQATPNRVAYYALGIPWLCVAPFFLFGVFVPREKSRHRLDRIDSDCRNDRNRGVFYGAVRFRDAVAPQLLWFAAVGIVAVISRYVRLDSSPR